MTLTPEQIEEIAAYLRDATRSLSGEGYFLSAHALGQKFDALLSSHRELQERVERADDIIEWMSNYLGRMAPPPNGLAELNEHFLFMQRIRKPKALDTSAKHGAPLDQNSRLQGE